MLKSNKIKLRAVEPEDIDWMYLIENDTELWKCSDNTVPFSYDALRRFIASNSNDIYADCQLRLAVETHYGDFCGFVDLMNFNPKNKRAEVGIVILSEQQRNGYATDALRLLADYAASHIDLHQLYAYVAEDNVASCRLFERSGFRHTANMKDWVHVGNEWKDVRLYQLLLSQ